jgi:hypothetical protein
MATSTRLVTKPDGFTIGLTANTNNTTAYAPVPTTTKPATVDTRVCVDVGYKNFVELLYIADANGFNSTIWRWKLVTNTYIPYSVASIDGEVGTVIARHASSTYTEPSTSDLFASTLIKIYGDPAVKVTNPAVDVAVASVLLDCQGANIIEIAFDCNGNTSGFSNSGDANVMWSLI